MDKIRNLGALTDYTSTLEGDFFQFQDTLDRLDADENLGFNDIRKTMEMVRIVCVLHNFMSTEDSKPIENFNGNLLYDCTNANY